MEGSKNFSLKRKLEKIKSDLSEAAGTEISNYQLANRLKIPYSSLCRMLSGEVKKPSQQNLNKLEIFFFNKNTKEIVESQVTEGIQGHKSHGYCNFCKHMSDEVFNYKTPEEYTFHHCSSCWPQPNWGPHLPIRQVLEILKLEFHLSNSAIAQQINKSESYIRKLQKGKTKATISSVFHLHYLLYQRAAGTIQNYGTTLTIGPRRRLDRSTMENIKDDVMDELERKLAHRIDHIETDGELLEADIQLPICFRGNKPFAGFKDRDDEQDALEKKQEIEEDNLLLQPLIIDLVVRAVGKDGEEAFVAINVMFSDNNDELKRQLIIEASARHSRFFGIWFIDSKKLELFTYEDFDIVRYPKW